MNDSVVIIILLQCPSWCKCY